MNKCKFCYGKGYHETGHVMCNIEGIHDTKQIIPCVACNKQGDGLYICDICKKLYKSININIYNGAL